MESKVLKNTSPTYYSLMGGITQAPYSITYGVPMSEPPIERMHYHSVPEIGICVQGSGEYYIGDKIYPFKKGDIQIIRPLVPHFAASNPHEVTSTNFFTYDIVKLMQFAGILDPEKAMLMKNIELPFSGVFGPDEYPELTYLIKKILNRIETSNSYTDISVAFNIGEFLITCREYAEKNIIPADDETLMKEYHRTAPAIYHIEMNIADSSILTIEELAKVCKMSPSNFRRLFLIETGLSPKAFIIKSRMSYAEYLLKNTDMTVISIAEKVGYNEISGFNRIFASTFKMSPSEYRKRYK